LPKVLKMALSKTPEVWAAGVESCGITDWRSVFELGSPMLRQYLVGLLGDPVRDKAVYEASSPLTYPAHLKAPLLVLAGGNDIRVPPEEQWLNCVRVCAPIFVVVASVR
jgi:dipeptidyl aminopeptidase/acylaminoacyl peptidase